MSHNLFARKIMKLMQILPWVDCVCLASRACYVINADSYRYYYLRYLVP